MASNQIKIGNYVLQQTIGVGTFGKVKLAVHSHTGHKVAMKIVNRRKIANMDMATRLKREVQYLKLLRHPHIIKLYEVITTPTDIIMVMEYAGGELFNYIVERGKMAEPDARRLFQQMICAVEHCHRHKIVHRDLKPENVLMDENHNVKIADFGLSNFMSDGNFLKTSCGSPNYAAPEVISGKLYAGPEIDVWSCGVILYVMVCGRLPFDDEYIPSLFKKINGGIFTLPSYLSPSVRELLQGMLTVDPLKRITIAQIRQNVWFTDALPEYLQPRPITEEVTFDEIDDSIVEELEQKMKFSKATILHALKETENNQIKVAYSLVVDNRQMRQDPGRSSHTNMKSFLSSSPPPWNQPSPNSSALMQSLNGIAIGSDAKAGRIRTSSIQIIPSSLPTVKDLIGTSTTDSSKKDKLRPRWHYGIRSRSGPVEIMGEIYRAISNVGMKWKTLDPFRIRCIHTTDAGTSVKMEIQLYQMDNRTYLVDFKAIDPPNSVSAASLALVDEPMPVFAFLDGCTRLITELAISS